MRNIAQHCKVTPCSDQLPPDAAEHTFADDGICAAHRKSHHVQRRCTVFASLRSGGFRTLFFLE